MNDSPAPTTQAERPLDVALGFLDEVDQGLVAIQAEETIVWRMGTVVLMAGGIAASFAALASLALLVRRFIRTAVLDSGIALPPVL